jgi:hypothetical protein
MDALKRETQTKPGTPETNRKEGIERKAQRRLALVAGVLLGSVFLLVVFWAGKLFFKKALVWFIAGMLYLIFQVLSTVVSTASGMDH